MLRETQSLENLSNTLKELNEIAALARRNASHGLYDEVDCVNSAEKYAEIRTSYQLMKGARDSLKCALENLQQTIEELETAVVASSMHHGLMSLPEEIFMHIIDVACAEAEKGFGRKKMDTLIRHLSLVSWTFRRAVENTVAFWTRIDNRYCLRDGFEDRIARARNASLVVHIDLEVAKGDCVRIISRIALLTDRCRQLDIRIPRSAPPLFPLLHFPNTDSVKIRFTYRDQSNSWFFERCIFANVRSLKSFGAIPSAHTRSYLTRVLLKSNGSSGVGVRWYDRLISFLDSAPHIESLSLDLDLLAGPEPGNIIQVLMPHLSAVYIYHTSGYRPGMLHHLQRILASLEMPNVRKCEFSLYLTDNKGLRGPPDVTQGTIPEVITLTVVSWFRLSAARLKELIRPFRNIRKLALDVPDVMDTLRGFDSNLALGQLRFVDLGRRFLRRSRAQHGEFQSLVTHPETLKIKFKDKLVHCR